MLRRRQRSLEDIRPTARATTPHEKARSAVSSGFRMVDSSRGTWDPSFSVITPDTERVFRRRLLAGVLNARWPYESAKAAPAAPTAPTEMGLVCAKKIGRAHV